MNIIYADLAATALDFSRSKYDPTKFLLLNPFVRMGRANLSPSDLSVIIYYS